jgi:hypothetical protein
MIFYIINYIYNFIYLFGKKIGLVYSVKFMHLYWLYMQS